MAFGTRGRGEIDRVTVAAGGVLMVDAVPVTPTGVRTEIIGR